MDVDPSKCNNSYIPTSDQYFAALGTFSTTILIFGGLITAGLFILFFEQVVYTNQTAHPGAKRHIYWIASVFPMMTLMSLVALAIPRAHNVCLSVKMVYMSIGISHFTNLTLVMFGDEELLVERAQNDIFNLRLPPMCCCCRCLPRPPVTKYSLRLVVLLTDQLPFSQAVYYVILMILLAADNITLGDVNPTSAFLWLNIFKLASVTFGVYGFMILTRFSRGYLDDFEYYKKSRSIHLLLVITNFQGTIFSIMAYYGAFPCLPPYVSPTVYKQTVDNSLYLLEMMILGPYTFWQYHDLRFSSPIVPLPSFRRADRSGSVSPKNSISGTISTIVSVTPENSDATEDVNSTRSDSNSSSRSSSTSRDMRKGTAVTPKNSSSSIIESRHRSVKDSCKADSGIASDSAKDSASSSSRKGRKSSGSSKRRSREKSSSKGRSNSREGGGRREITSMRMDNSASNTINSNREDSAKGNSNSSKREKDTADPEPSSNGASTCDRRESASPSRGSGVSSATPSHGTPALASRPLDRAGSPTPLNTEGKSYYRSF